EPGAGGMPGLQIGVDLVERVAAPIVLERHRLAAAVAAYEITSPRRFVDVIAQVNDQIGLIGDDVPVRREVALLVVLAGDEGEAQARRSSRWQRRGARAAGSADSDARGEAIP